jgi:hypothetical protein
MDFNSIMDDYFNEWDKGTTAPDPKSTKGSPTEKAMASPTTAQQTSIDNANNKPVDGLTKETVTVIETYYKNVFGMIKDFVSTRLTVSEAAYRDYMKFLRWHVGEYSGSKDKQSSGGDVITNNNDAKQSQQETDANKIDSEKKTS